MLYFQRKSLSFETALSYLQAFTSNSHEFLWKISSLFQHFNSLCKVNGVLCHFLNAVLSEKITFLSKCLKLLISIHQQLTWVFVKEKQSVPTHQFTVWSECVVVSLSKCSTFRENHFLWNCLKLLTSIYQQHTWVSLKEKQSVQHFNSLCEVNGVLRHFVNAVLSEKITVLWNCLKLLTSIHQQHTWVSLKEKQSVQHFNSLCEVNGVLCHFLNAVISEKITFLWKCPKLLTSIHKKLTCVSLTEKQSVPKLQ